MVRRRGFTLIELLVVIAIIAILAAMLLPVLKRARAQARVGVCMSNQRQVSLSMFMYVDGYGGQLPWTYTTANPSACQLVAFGRISGIGVMAQDKYIKNHQILYCPDYMPTNTGWGGGVRNRQLHMSQFWSRLRPDGALRCDYTLGWWTDPGKNPGILRHGTTLHNYEKVRKIWLADCRGIFPYWYLRSIFHLDCTWQNVSRTDGSVATIADYQARMPRTTYYYPWNDRPGWGWWNYWNKELAR